MFDLQIHFDYHNMDRAGSDSHGDFGGDFCFVGCYKPCLYYCFHCPPCRCFEMSVAFSPIIGFRLAIYFFELIFFIKECKVASRKHNQLNNRGNCHSNMFRFSLKIATHTLVTIRHLCWYRERKWWIIVETKPFGSESKF